MFYVSFPFPWCMKHMEADAEDDSGKSKIAFLNFVFILVLLLFLCLCPLLIQHFSLLVTPIPAS